MNHSGNSSISILKNIADLGNAHIFFKRTTLNPAIYITGLLPAYSDTVTILFFYNGLIS